MAGLLGARQSYGLAQKRLSSSMRNSGNDDQPSTGVNTPSNTLKQARVTKSNIETNLVSSTESKPKRRRHLRVHLLRRREPLAQVTPSPSPTQINTALASLNTSSPHPNFPKPHYLSTKYARLIPAYAFTRSSPDPYILTRSIELFGSPGKTDWIAEMKERVAAVSVLDKVTGLLSRLEWMDRGVRGLKDTAWAEHLVAMQNPRLGKELEEDINTPAWPSAQSDLKSGLSWSTSGERDVPLSYYSSHARTPAYTLGKHNFPRPKRIIRLRPYDKSLVL
ncbi:hypothetical protein FRC07_009633, partial [Ceratobasidium sp. 392]